MAESNTELSYDNQKERSGWYDAYSQVPKFKCRFYDNKNLHAPKGH